MFDCRHAGHGRPQRARQGSQAAGAGGAAEAAVCGGSRPPRWAHAAVNLKLKLQHGAVLLGKLDHPGGCITCSRFELQPACTRAAHGLSAPSVKFLPTCCLLVPFAVQPAYCWLSCPQQVPPIPVTLAVFLCPPPLQAAQHYISLLPGIGLMLVTTDLTLICPPCHQARCRSWLACSSNDTH